MILCAVIMAIAGFADMALAEITEEAPSKFSGTGDRIIRITPMLETSIIFGGEIGEVSVHNDKRAIDSPDIYPMGYGAVIEGGWRFEDNFEAVVGLGYAAYPADVVMLSNGVGDKISLAFDDLNVIPFYGGIRMLFTSEPDKGFVPYIRGDLGLIWIGAIDAEIKFEPKHNAYEPMIKSTEWWGSSTHFMYDLGGGFEYRFGSAGLFCEVISRSFNTPSDSNQTFINHMLFNRTGSGWIPVNMHLGFSYYF